MGVRYSHPEALTPTHDVAYHPGRLYEVVLALAMLAVLWPLRRRLERPGQMLWAVVGLYSLGRLVMFAWRSDSPAASPAARALVIIESHHRPPGGRSSRESAGGAMVRRRVTDRMVRTSWTSVGVPTTTTWPTGSSLSENASPNRRRLCSRKPTGSCASQVDWTAEGSLGPGGSTARMAAAARGAALVRGPVKPGGGHPEGAPGRRGGRGEPVAVAIPFTLVTPCLPRSSTSSTQSRTVNPRRLRPSTSDR